jgi:hypothetical protein
LKSARYPRCIVLRAGTLDPFLQDLTVNLALRMKGGLNTEYIYINKNMPTLWTPGAKSDACDP